MTFLEKKKKWWEYHRDNPHVYNYFTKYTLQAISSGAKKCSPWLIIGRIRW
jgi:hypothetical protein